MLFKFLQSPQVIKLFSILDKYSIEARFVGGAVRDALLYTQKQEIDFDIAVAHDINNVANVLSAHNIHCITTNIKYKTIIAIVDNTKFELTELRRDRECAGRACTTESATSFEEDAHRRDFTINALYLDKNGKIYDYFNAINGGDIYNRVVRFIGDPILRIKEDYLRILRYYRFCAIYNDASDMYSSAVLHTKTGLKNLSIERIQSELFKILNAKYCKDILMQMQECGIFEEILTNINQDMFCMIERDSWCTISLEAKIYLLFGNKAYKNLKLSNSQKKVIELYNFITAENLEYIYYKHPIQVAQDIIHIRNIIGKKNDFYKITPMDCNITPTNFSRKLSVCEKWFVCNGYTASRDQCIEYIKNI